MWRTLLTLLSLVSTYAGQAQIEYDYDLIYAGGQIEVQIELSAGSICFGIDILHAAADGNFKVIGQIPGICGDAGFAQTFSHLHTNPLNHQRNYYRIDFGGVLLSHIDSVDISYVSGSELVVLGQPMREYALIRFSNPKDDDLRLSVFDMNGRLARTHEIAGGNELSMPRNGLPSGTYQLVLEGPSEPRLAPLVVQ